jgi:hypothetical protein
MIRVIHSDNLVELEDVHLAAVVLGAGPFLVEHCEVGDMGKLWVGDSRRWRRWEQSINRR